MNSPYAPEISIHQSEEQYFDDGQSLDWDDESSLDWDELSFEHLDQSFLDYEMSSPEPL